MPTVVSDRRRIEPGERLPLPTFVDLFAGCGGLSLGLERAGFEPIFVNELDANAMQTYLANRRARHPHLASKMAHDIIEVTGNPDILRATAEQLRRDAGARTGHADVDLVVGGPPCQGYSRIGHRRTFVGLRKADIPSNHLYEEMAKFIEVVRPRAFLFENVRGVMSGRWTPSGSPGEIWADVQARFRNIAGYDVRATLVYAREYGVPQNRPRVLMVGIRSDLGWRPERGGVAEGLLPLPTNGAPDPIDFLGDLVDPEYSEKRATTTYPGPATSETQRWYRADPLTLEVAPEGAALTEHEYSRHSLRIVEKFQWMIDHEGQIRSEDRTKKFAQHVLPRTWGSAGPTITATSIPDDYVHFSQPRILTVREWARLQTFPDWYQFAGKRTTGGRRRAGDPDAGDWSRDVPKYTQIGNAVPVLLAEAVGRHLRELIR